MSSLSNLAPISGRNANITKNSFDTSVDDFDALLDDMLESPRVKGPGKANSQRSRSGNQGLDKKYDSSSFDGGLESFSDPSSPNLPVENKQAKNTLDDSNGLSVDENGLLMDVTVTTDDLEDSILGGLLKGKSKSNVVARKGSKADSSASDLSEFPSHNKNTNVKGNWGDQVSKKTEAVKSPVLSDSDYDDDFSDSSQKNKVDKSKSKSSYSGLSDKKVSGFTSATAAVPAVQQGQSSSTTKTVSDFDELSDDEEEESAYMPTVRDKKIVPQVSPHRPTTLQPSSTSNSNTNSWGVGSGSGSGGQSTFTAGPRKVTESSSWNNSEPEKTEKSDKTEFMIEKDKEKDKDTDDTDIGFVPSFLEAGRLPRQRRNLGGSSSGPLSSMGGGIKGPGTLDDLDFALGLRAGSGASASAAGSGSSKAVDPFLNAGSISSGTSLGLKASADKEKERARAQSYDSDSDSDRSAAKPFKPAARVSAHSASAPSITSSLGPGIFDKAANEFQSVPTPAPASAIAPSALPSLSRASSFPSPLEKNVVPRKDITEEEDELDVSGIVRIQNFEQVLSEGDRQEDRRDKSIPVSAGSRWGSGSGSGGGSTLTVDTASYPVSTPKSPTVSSQRGASAFGLGSGLGGQTQTRGDQTPPASRRDKFVSFEQTGRTSSSPSAASASLKPATGQFGLDDPSWGSTAATGPPAGSSLSPSSQSSSAQIFKLQHRLEEAQLQRESAERVLKFEVESLKARILTQSDGLGNSLSSSAHNAHLLEMQGEHETVKNKLQDELNNLRRKVSQLEAELARLMDEATIQALKHGEEIKYLRDRREAELGDMERRKEEELRCIERRHADSVSALKQVHLDELQAVRGRARDGVALDQLAGQIKQTSGSIKLLEENLNVRYKGLDAAKEGQLEARERLLTEMELKAKERVEAAEIESYRLKGLLVHMEHVAAQLRGQGGEETERLRQEHHRLQVMQSSLESERKAVQARAADDASSLRQKARDMETEGRRVQEERRVVDDSLIVARQKLEADRADFAAHVSSASRAAEHGAAQLKEEEARLKRVREDLSDQKAQFEKKKLLAHSDLQAADQVRRSVLAAKEDLVRERALIDRMVRDYQLASDRMALRGEAIDVQESGLAEREMHLKEGIAHMQSEAMVLSRREADVRDSSRLQQQHRVSIEDAERTLTNKRIESAAIQRSLSGRQAAASIFNLLVPPNPYQHPQEGSPTLRNSDGYQGRMGGTGVGTGGGSGPESDLLTQLRNRPTLGGQGPPKGQGKELTGAEKQQMRLEEQALNAAKQVLDSVRGQLSRSSKSRQEMTACIEQEAAFLGTMTRRRTGGTGAGAGAGAAFQ